MKIVENKFYLHCTKKCVNFDVDLLDEKEETCLKDCNRKIEAFLKIAKNNFKNIEDNLNQTTSNYV